jgi:hypothetical protein
VAVYRRWANLFVDFLVTKHGLALALSPETFSESGAGVERSGVVRDG